MSIGKIILLMVMCFIGGYGIATAQIGAKNAHIGYVYPAGGQQGQTFYVVVAGQQLRNAKEVYISGTGVRAEVVEFSRVPNNIQREQKVLIAEQILEMQSKKMKQLGLDLKQVEKRQGIVEKRKLKMEELGELKGVKLPKHPLLFQLEKKSLRELKHINEMLNFPRAKKQQNQQLAENVIVKVSVRSDAAVGLRELRVGTRSGLSNPVKFEIGAFREINELEPNDFKAIDSDQNVEDMKPLKLPVVLNGQIMPGDIDRFRFKAHKGQSIVTVTHARTLIPYLADAVPGWFQATVKVYDANDNEVAYEDDWQFEPDPVLQFIVPEDGDYEIEIKDAIYRGREDFVYRLVVGEFPFVKSIYPLGGHRSGTHISEIDGWNLKQTRMRMQFERENSSEVVHQIQNRLMHSVLMKFQTGQDRESREREPNNSYTKAQNVPLNTVVNGLIDTVGDHDIYEFYGRANQKVNVEVYGRRLGSPIDSVAKVYDSEHHLLAWNDDHVIKAGHLHKDEIGLLTHHADSFLQFTIPNDGRYYVRVLEAQNKGGDAYGYRLHIREMKPDFQLRVTPSSLVLRPGTVTPIEVHALRTDGFHGAIRVDAVKNDLGLRIDGGVIPEGRDKIQMTIGLDGHGFKGIQELELVGRYEDELGRIVEREVIASDEVMQAFLWRHLVPAEALLVAGARSKWNVSVPEVVIHEENGNIVVLDHSKSTEIEIKASKWLVDRVEDVKLAHNEIGIAIKLLRKEGSKLVCELKASDANSLDRIDNVVIELLRNNPSRSKNQSSKVKGQNTNLIRLGLVAAFQVHVK